MDKPDWCDQRVWDDFLKWFNDPSNIGHAMDCPWDSLLAAFDAGFDAGDSARYNNG